MICTRAFALSLTAAVALIATGCVVDTDSEADETLGEIESELETAAAPTLSLHLEEPCTNNGPLYFAKLSGTGGFRLEWFHHGAWHTMKTSTTNSMSVFGSETQTFTVRGCRGSCSAQRPMNAHPCGGGGPIGHDPGPGDPTNPL